jgi:hypothetical protein
MQCRDRFTRSRIIKVEGEERKRKLDSNPWRVMPTTSKLRCKKGIQLLQESTKDRAKVESESYVVQQQRINRTRLSNERWMFKGLMLSKFRQMHVAIKAFETATAIQ